MSRARKSRVARAGSARVSATEAAKNFGRLVDRVRESRATYIVERGGAPAAQIGPVAGEPFTMRDFKALVAALPQADEEYLVEVERAAARHGTPRVRRNPWER